MKITTLVDFWRIIGEAVNGHEASRTHLGHAETARQREIRLSRRHPESRPSVSADLAAAREGRGPTVCDWLLEIFEDRAPGTLRLR